VRERPILTRVAAGGRDTRSLTPLDLAEDRATDVTDQNHVGGSRMVFGLADAAGISSDDVVLDLGCGLGGSARLLAHRYRCRVDGIDISRQRVREGNRLTALVGMTPLVHLKRADMLRVRVPASGYDVLWGQGAWDHVVDKARFVSRWRAALRPRGRIALEDVYLKRPPRTAAECRLVDGLERDWHATFVSRGEWAGIFASVEATVKSQRDYTAVLVRYFLRLEATANRTDVPALERRAWGNAVRAAGAGLIGYLRMVAVCP
jgi:cyclopropane fatty-acyl-phospholipid synthase-like methyltransferase